MYDRNMSFKIATGGRYSSGRNAFFLASLSLSDTLFIDESNPKFVAGGQ